MAPSPERVLVHQRVLEGILKRGPVLPLRFGSQPVSEEELAATLDTRQRQLVDALERVRGRVELGIRVFAAPGEPPPDTETSGREYLLHRVAEHRRANRAAADLHEPLEQLAVAGHLREHPSPPAILVGSYLVEEEEVGRFRLRADALADTQPDLRTVVTGPFPPYSFAEEGP